MGKDQQPRRLYCRTCGHRFSERQGSLLEYAKLPPETVVRIVKCLVHGCSIEATSDICEVRRRTVELVWKKAGRRAEDFHRLQLEKNRKPLEVVESDELHGRSAPPKKGARPLKLSLPPSPVAHDAARAHVDSCGDSYGVGGRNAIPDRLLIDLRIGPRTLETALVLPASAAICCAPFAPLMILADDHRPYPQAILKLFGVTRNRRRPFKRQRQPDLKPPPGLLAGVVSKLWDAAGTWYASSGDGCSAG